MDSGFLATLGPGMTEDYRLLAIGVPRFLL
jgi:hypothetical protein